MNRPAFDVLAEGVLRIARSPARAVAFDQMVDAAEEQCTPDEFEELCARLVHQEEAITRGEVRELADDSGVPALPPVHPARAETPR